jgi:hypothetical protein
MYSNYRLRAFMNDFQQMLGKFSVPTQEQAELRRQHRRRTKQKGSSSKLFYRGRRTNPAATLVDKPDD